MKNLKLILAFALIAVFLGSCATTHNSPRYKVERKVAAGKKIPPGQAKKVFGGETKDYAPGQVKKRNR